MGARGRRGHPRGSEPSPRILERQAGPPLPWTSPPYLFVLIVAFACILVSVSFRIYEYDWLEHLTVGKAIWRLGRVPRTELWTWLDYGTPVVNPSWGFSAVLWPFWAWGGELGLAAWRWLTTLVVFALLWRTSRAFGAREPFGLVVLVIASLVYRQRSQVRPETLAAVLLALELWLLAARRRRWGWHDAALITVVWLWANVHISWFLGVVLLALGWLAGVARGPSRSLGHADGLGRVAVLAGLAALLNPFGWRAVWRPFEFALSWRTDPLLSGISELRAIDWGANLSNGLPILLLGWPAVALWRWRRRGPDPFELGCCGCFTVLALAGTRFVATYAMVAAPFCARGLDDLARARRWPARLGGPWRVALLCAALCVAVGLYEWTNFEDRLGVRVDDRRYPVAACDFMTAQGVRGRGINDFYLGGYMLWRFWPDRTRLPFFDIHPEDKSPEERLAYLLAFSSPQGWERLDGRYHFDYALLSRSHAGHYGLLDLLDGLPGWALVFVDDAAALYVRRDGPLARLAAAQGYRLLPGGETRFPQLEAACARDPALAAQLRAELARQASSSPRSASFAPLRAACAPARP